MKLQSRHIAIGEKVSLGDLKKCLLSKGFVSATDEAAKTFRKYTEPLNVNIAFPFVTPPSSDLLARPDINSLCYIELVGESEEARYTNLIIASEDELAGSQLLADCESAFGAQKAIKGTFQEAQLAESLKKRLKQGTHGVLLSDPEFTPSFEILYDPVVRQQIYPFVETFGNSAVSGAFIEEAIPRRSGLRKSDIRRLINNEVWFSKQFSIGCNRCGASTLAFSTREEAQESLSHSTSHRCFMCEENTLGIVEVFALKEALSKGLQGLWLEHLVHQIMQPASLLSMAGKQIEGFEVDVVSLTCEQVILFECKDTSFGERDFWMSVPKAQALNADILWIVTTQPLHDNVRNAIDRQKSQARFNIFVTEKLADQQSIASDISQKLEQVQNSLFSNLLTSESRFYPYVPSLRRRLLARSPRRLP